MSYVGRFLIATPLIGDPNFERTVILVLAHGDVGAFGVVVNRPTGTDVAEIVPEWAPSAAEPKLMFLGGPVGPSAVVGLCRAEPGREPSTWQQLTGRIGTLDLNAPEEAEGRALEVRLFAGSAGWAAGQVEDEVAEGAWWLVDAQEGDVFSAEPFHLWSTVLRRQRGPLAWFANHPADPSSN